MLILGVLLRHEREAEDADVDGCGGGDDLGSSSDGLTAGLGFPLANRELRKLVRRAPGEMDGLFHLLQIRVHLHGGGFGFNQILAKDVDPDSLRSSLPKAVSLLEWAISGEPFENLPDHAYEGIADWERTLIQDRESDLLERSTRKRKVDDGTSGNEIPVPVETPSMEAA
nr:phosphoglucan phosphatase LSF2, chloroplastic [Ipomoea batatas]